MLYVTPQKINMQPWSNIFTVGREGREAKILFEEKSTKYSYYLYDYCQSSPSPKDWKEKKTLTVFRIALFLLKLKNYNSKDSIE